MELCGWSAGEEPGALHRSATAWANEGALRRWRKELALICKCIEEQLQPLKGGFAAGVHKAAIADAVESCRECMLEESANKFHTLDQAGLETARIAVFDADAHMPVLNAKDTPIADDAAVDVLPEIFDGVVSASGRIHRSVPWHFDKAPEELLIDQSEGEQVPAQQGAQAGGQRLGMEQEPALSAPFEMPLAVETDRRNDIVNMGVPHHLLSPALIHAKEPITFKTAAGRIGKQLSEGL